jgi:hypothetical protein
MSPAYRVFDVTVIDVRRGRHSDGYVFGMTQGRGGKGAPTRQLRTKSA